ncbi:general secretion pathway protein H [Marinobacterium mangrovicola]|uniref:General secretion pathway protein H n=2 Tax=Marinobacterium mangrovicola TaxID=1476959 RepID=A0A4R1GNE3_9GAMM|nr:general secretion pathway protein H [Marinobacterium mangrovicola]
MTLLELLVVLVIASLMLTLVAPNIANVLPGSELKAFARQSAALLRELRSEAVSQSQVQQLVLDKEAREYRNNGEVVMSWPDEITVALSPGELPAFMRNPFVGSGALMFYPDGSSNGGLLSLATETSGSYSIEVDGLSGRISIDER